MISFFITIFFFVKKERRQKLFGKNHAPAITETQAPIKKKSSISGYFYVTALSAILLCVSPLFALESTVSVKLPAIFHHGLIYLAPVSDDGEDFLFFTDTGDGTLMYESSAKRHRIDLTSAPEHYPFHSAARLPSFRPEAFIPSPSVTNGWIPVRPEEQKPPHHEILLNKGDGILGHTWFADRIWSIHYPKEKMTLHLPKADALLPGKPGKMTHHAKSGEQDDTKKETAGREEITPHWDTPDGHSGITIPLGFRKTKKGERISLPTIEVVIAGDTLSMVFKSGSHIILNEAHQKELGHPGALLPAGLISESIYQRWRNKHPEWPIYEKADTFYGSDLIETPGIQIGVYASGPVRFAVRRDDAFTDWLSRFTDKPVQGVLGPDAFREAHITLHYPRSVLIIHK